MTAWLMFDWHWALVGVIAVFAPLAAGLWWWMWTERDRDTDEEDWDDDGLDEDATELIVLPEHGERLWDGADIIGGHHLTEGSPRWFERATADQVEEWLAAAPLAGTPWLEAAR